MNQLDLVAENQRLKAKNQALEKAVEQFIWERDVAIEQLESYGVGFAEKADVVRVVRCINCKYLEISGCYGECGMARLGIVHPDDYCSRGERKG